MKKLMRFSPHLVISLSFPSLSLLSISPSFLSHPLSLSLSLSLSLLLISHSLSILPLPPPPPVLLTFNSISPTHLSRSRSHTLLVFSSPPRSHSQNRIPFPPHIILVQVGPKLYLQTNNSPPPSHPIILRLLHPTWRRVSSNWFKNQTE